MKRIRSSGDEVTLFPFLAVLICTMGSLIVLLVVVVQQAKASAGRVAQERAAQQDVVNAEAGEIATQLEELQWRIDILNSSRSQSAEEHARQQAELSYLEDEIRQLRDRILRAAEEADQIEQLATSSSQQAVDATRQLQELREKLDYARESLAQARANRSNREPSYSLVPYEGANGTRRRPLFVECLTDRIVLQPEGIELLAEDFAEPLTDDNPLAASLRAQREYLKDAAADDRETAYPLIVVRPDGAQSYAAARAAMQSWDTEFGYELIDADMKLAYPPADPALSKVVKAAVEESRLRRQMLQSIAPARFGRTTTPARLTASKSGGFVSKGESGGAGSGATRAGSPRSTARSGSGSGGWGQSGNGLASAGGVASSRQSRGSARGGSFGDAGSEVDGMAIVGSAIDANGQANGSLNGAGRGGSSSQDASAGAGEGGAVNSGGANAGGSATDGDATARQAGTRRPGTSSAANAGESTGRDADGGASGSDGNGSDASRAGNQSSSQAAGTERSGRAGTRGGASNSGSAAGRSAGGSASGQASGRAGGGSNAASSAGGSASGGSSFGADASIQPLSNARGSDWGLPERSGESTGITRPISMACYPDRLVMFPENPVRGRPYELAVEGSMRDEMDEFVTRIWKRMDNWGIAGAQMYWKPVLQVQVEAGGEDRFAELAALLEDSGIVVKRK